MAVTREREISAVPGGTPEPDGNSATFSGTELDAVDGRRARVFLRGRYGHFLSNPQT